MREVKIKLNNLDEAAVFVEVMENWDVRADISMGRHSLDAKSLMGILTMDLNRELNLTLYEEEDRCNEVIGKITEFVR